MKAESKEQFYEVITEQAVEISRLRKKCSDYDRDVKRLEGVTVGYERECKRLRETIVSLGGSF